MAEPLAPTSRRTLLAALAAPAAASLPIPAAAAEDPHIAWWQEYEELEGEAEDADDDAFADILHEGNELLELIAETPARTVAGVLAQIRVVQLGIEMGEAAFDAAALANALDTLEQLAGRA